jgi:hypothetical protein
MAMNLAAQRCSTRYKKLARGKRKNKTPRRSREFDADNRWFALLQPRGDDAYI